MAGSIGMKHWHEALTASERLGIIAGCQKIYSFG